MQKHQRCVLEGPKHAKSFSLPAAKFLPRCRACPGAVRAQDRDRSCAGQCWGGWRSRRTNLGVGAVLLLALPTGEEVGLRPSCLGHLMLPDRFFRHGFPDLFQLVTGHFLSKGKKKSNKITSAQFYRHTHHRGRNQGDRRGLQMAVKPESLLVLVTGPCVDPCDELTSQQTLHAAIPTASFLPMHWGSSC